MIRNNTVEKIDIFAGLTHGVRRLLFVILFALIVASCASVTPIVVSAAVKFAQDLLQVATHNVSPRYASEVEMLLLALLHETTGLNLDSDEASSTAYAGRDASVMYSERGSQQSHYPAASDTSKSGPATRGERIDISMDVGLLAQRISASGEVTLEAIEDGAILYDGRGDPAAGDKLKVTFRTNCNCYIYIVGIDATGFVAKIFPDPDSAHGNPIEADRQYMVPDGDIWWGLDDYRGVETVYFLASHERRQDIEMLVENLSNTGRRLPANYKTVQVAPVIPQVRGMVKVQAAQPTSVKTSMGTPQSVTPTAFSATSSNVDLVVTRWFLHQ